MGQSPVLDLTVLNELRDIMGVDFHTLVVSFVRDGRQRIEALHAALADKDAEQTRQQAHSFKGSSGNLGALRVTGLCLEIEQHARRNDLTSADALMEALENEFRKACDSLYALDE